MNTIDPHLTAILLELEKSGRDNDLREADRSRKMLNLEADTAALVHLLVRASHRKSILEIGTSNGYSTLWLADAMRACGGTVTSIDREPAKIALARANLERAHLSRLVTLIQGDATEIVAGLRTPFDCIFFDADRFSAPHQLELLLPRLPADVLMLCDNVLSHPSEVSAYLEAVAKLLDFASVTVPLGKGLHIAYRQNEYAGQSHAGQLS